MPGLSSGPSATSLSGMAFEGSTPPQLHIPEGEAIPHTPRRIAKPPAANPCGAAPADRHAPAKGPEPGWPGHCLRSAPSPCHTPGRTLGRHTCGKPWQRAWRSARELRQAPCWGESANFAPQGCLDAPGRGGGCGGRKAVWLVRLGALRRGAKGSELGRVSGLSDVRE